MSKNINKRGASKRIVEELAKRMLEGERITLDDCVMEFFVPATEMAAIKGKGKMAGLIQQACRKVEGKNGEGEMAGSLARQTWGVPQTPEEVIKVLAGKYVQLVGRNEQARKWVDWSQKKGMELPGLSNERVIIHRIGVPEEKTETK